MLKIRKKSEGKGKTARFMKKVLLSVLLLVLIVMIVACAPQAASEEGSQKTASNGETSTTALPIEWSSEADCTTCHVAEAESRENANCLAALHATTNCIDCHAETETMAAEHEGVTTEDKVPKRLSKTSVSEDYCLTCHENYEILAEKTADYQDLVDSEGTIVNPHVVPAVDNHADITCMNCHSLHAADADPTKKGKATCVGCHHENVFTCGTCHN